MAQKDQRLYGKFTLDFPRHPKIAILSDAAFRCLVEATLYSRDQLSDGLLARRYALATWGPDVLAELCSNDDENPSLIETEKGWVIHDYAEHQDTKADIEARRERNKLAGQKGGLAKAKRAAKRGAKQVASKSLSENVAETETETETHKEPANAGSTRGRAQRGQPTFGEMLRGEPDPVPPPPPTDVAAKPVAATSNRRIAEKLVKTCVPAGHPSAVLSELRNQANALLLDGQPEELVAEALRLWSSKGVHPKVLPSLVSEVITGRQQPTQRPTAYERKTAHNAEVFARLAAKAQTPAHDDTIKELTQ